jgi:hypothetical protein
MASTPSSTRIGLAFAVGALMAMQGTSSLAQSSSGDKVTAEALFEQGRRLVAAGKYAEACPSFADSQRLDPSPGTLLNLANCYEKLGRTATAWATYKEAASAANAAGRPDYVSTAERHADALSPKLAHLVTTVSRPVDGEHVRRDGVEVAGSAWGVPLPVDTGTHLVEASAPGYKPWSTTVEVTQDGSNGSVAVPALEALPPSTASASPAPPPPPPAVTQSAPPPPEAPPSGGSTQRIIGVVVTGVGITGLAASGAFAILAKSTYNQSVGNCESSNANLCTPTGVSQRNTAMTEGNVASVALGVGAAALVAGAITWLTAPSGSSSRNGTTGILVAPWPGGIEMQGAW